MRIPGLPSVLGFRRGLKSKLSAVQKSGQQCDSCEGHSGQCEGIERQIAQVRSACNTGGVR